MDLPQVVILSHANLQRNFIITAINDMILENYEESFTFSLSLESPSVLASLDTTELEINILDNEGKLQAS